MSIWAVYQIALILGVGITAQYLAHRLGVPSILLYLGGGILAGPIANLIEPDRLFGELLQPFVSLAVALVLFEGGLSLRLIDFPRFGRAIIGLLLIGTFISWVSIALAVHHFFGLRLEVALLIAAIGVVSGPTVITPLLRHLRPVPPLGEILRWEAILIDPLGVLLAVFVFELLAGAAPGAAPALIFRAMSASLLTGFALGALCGWLLAQAFSRFFVPDHMQCGVTMAALVACYVAANTVYPESGLVSVIVAGMILRNLSPYRNPHISSFFETLQELLIPGLFTLLAARLDLAALQSVLSFKTLQLLLVLIFIIRPLSVMISTLGTNLSLRERCLIGFVAPRGIVAASLASLLALRLEALKVPDAEFVGPISFAIIVGTVVFYGIFSPPIARLLSVQQESPQGILIVGAHRTARLIASALSALGVKVMLVDSSYWNVAQAQSEGLKAFFGSIVSEETQELIDLSGIGKLLAVTSNDELNTFAVMDFHRTFGVANLFQLAPIAPGSKHRSAARGRVFPVTFKQLEEAVRKPDDLAVVTVGEGFTTPQGSTPLFSIDEKMNLTLATADLPLRPKAGEKLVVAKVAEAQPSKG